MDTKALKDKILQLAIQGKLIEQNPNDEPASILLEKIEEEKERLIKEGKINNEKSLAHISKDEITYELPIGWEWVRLGSIIQLISGRDLEASEYNDNKEGIPYITGASNINKDEIIINRWTINPKVLSYYGDLLISCKGTVGKTIINIVGDCHIARQIMAIRLFSKSIDNNYLKFFVDAYINKLKEKAKSMIPGISREDVLLIPFSLPPLTEQKRIVEKIDELFYIIDELDTNKNELLEAINYTRSKILQEAVQGKLVPQLPNDEPVHEFLSKIVGEKERLIKEGTIKKEKPLPPIKEDESPYELPYGWKWVRLGSICEIITKGSSPNWQGINYIEDQDGVLFITSENVGKYKLILDNRKYLEWRFNKIEPRSILKKGDILMNIVGASIGRTALYDIDDIANINQAVCLIRIIKQNRVFLSYLLHFFNSSTCINYMYDKLVDSARANLSMGNISKFLIPIPPYSEQIRIVERVQQMMSLCDELENNIEKSNNDSKLLM